MPGTATMAKVATSTMANQPTPNRRTLMGATVVGAVGVAGAVGFGTGRATAPAEPQRPRPDTRGLNGEETVPFYGEHQAGVETPPQAHGMFIALTLRENVDRDGVRRLLTLLSDDAAALTQGKPPLGDTEPELTERPARLTVTFGFGPGLVERVRSAPDWLKPLPRFDFDRFQPGRTDGDLLLQVCSDDPATVAHAVRMLIKDARAFTNVAWTREGFRRAYGSDPQGTTVRNPFGQVDGTANPGPGSEDFARLVWGTTTGATPAVFSARGEPPRDLANHYPAWLQGGTTLVIRDIEMNMATWDQADRPAREFAVGRDMARGAPLTGTDEHDIPDLEAKNELGLSVISPVSHVARSRNTQDPAEQIYRRVYSYQEGLGATGLILASYQANIDRQFLPIQQRLAQADLLNEWTTPVGSTVWAIPPGASEGGFVGQTLFA